MAEQIPGEAIRAADAAIREHMYIWAQPGRESSCSCGEWTGSEDGPHHAEHLARAALSAAAPLLSDATTSEYAALHAAIEQLADEFDDGRESPYWRLVEALRDTLAAHPAPNDRDNRIRAEHGERIARAIEAHWLPGFDPHTHAEAARIARDTSPPEVG